MKAFRRRLSERFSGGAGGGGGGDSDDGDDVLNASHHSFVPPMFRKANLISLAAHEEVEQLAQKKGGGRRSAVEEFLVKPDYAYPNKRMNRDKMRTEMNKPSAHFHDLRLPPTSTTTSAGRQEEIGLLKVEFLQCFGLPALDQLSENDTFCMAVCGSYAFKTDIMPPVANPMWLSKMRRACIFPLFYAYARLYVGVFDDDPGDSTRDDFAGRIVLDVARMRPGCTYDVTLPLRLSAHVYMKRPRGAIRLRFRVSWHSERAAMLSYLPKSLPKFEPHESVTVNCCDKKSFQNAALVVHGTHPPGKFSMKRVKAMVREINFTRIHLLRYMTKRELQNLMGWKIPIISCFVFCSWMHSVYNSTLRYAPGNLLTLLLLYLWRNYAEFAIDDSLHRGFLPPTWEEMFFALLSGTTDKHCIQPLEMTAEKKDDDPSVDVFAEPCNNADDEPRYGERGYTLDEISVAFQKGVRVSTYRYRLKTYKHAFVGSEAVDFLVKNGYAASREEAVTIGCHLAEKKQLFEHVNRKHGFKDGYLYYHFLILDDAKYTFKTHIPRGKTLFRMLGFLNESRSYAKDQLEMPYSNGEDHPRFTIKESLVVRTKEGKERIKQFLAKGEQEEDEDDDAAELGMEDGFDLTESTPSLTGSFRMDQSESDECGADTVGTVKQLKKPPIQDIDFKTQSDRPITKVLAESRDKVHGVLLNSFNDRTYVVRTNEIESRLLRSMSSKRVMGSPSAKRKGLGSRNWSQRALQRSLTSTESLSAKSDGSDPRKDFQKTASSKRTGSRNWSQRALQRSLTSTESVSATSVGSDPRKDFQKIASSKRTSKRNSESNLKSEKEDNDKLLKIGLYSDRNKWVAKIGVIVQPIVEILYVWIYLFRALFNVFTWRDPILSFWVSLIGPFVVVVLHLFPWRIFLGMTGLFLWGPQNWIARLIRERKGISPPDTDKIIRREKSMHRLPVDEEMGVEEPLFSNNTDKNRPIDYESLDRSNVKHIAVPDSPLMYNHRFYDWPPDPDYARVYEEDPHSCPKFSIMNDRDSTWTHTARSESEDSNQQRKSGKSWLGLLRFSGRKVKQS